MQGRMQGRMQGKCGVGGGRNSVWTKLVQGEKDGEACLGYKRVVCVVGGFDKTILFIRAAVHHNTQYFTSYHRCSGDSKSEAIHKLLRRVHIHVPQVAVLNSASVIEAPMHHGKLDQSQYGVAMKAALLFHALAANLLLHEVIELASSKASSQVPDPTTLSTFHFANPLPV